MDGALLRSRSRGSPRRSRRRAARGPPRRRAGPGPSTGPPRPRRRRRAAKARARREIRARRAGRSTGRRARPARCTRRASELTVTVPRDHHDAHLAVARVALGHHARRERQHLEADVRPAGRRGRDVDERPVRGGAGRGMDDAGHSRAHSRNCRWADALRSYSARAARTVSCVGDLGDRHVPPAVVAGHAGVAVGLDVDHGRSTGPAPPRASASAARSSCDRPCPDDPRAQALGVGGEVDREHVGARGRGQAAVRPRRRRAALRWRRSGSGCRSRPSRPSARARRSTRSRGCRRARSRCRSARRPR